MPDVVNYFQKWLNVIRHFPTIQSPALVRELSYKLVVVGGGAGGCGTANKFANKLGKDQVFNKIGWMRTLLEYLNEFQVAVIEPGEMHYYQPMWTLVRHLPEFS